MNKRLREISSYLNVAAIVLVCACVPDARLTKLPPLNGTLDLNGGGTTGSSGTSDSSGSSSSSSGSGDPVRDNFNQTFQYAKYDVLWVVDNSGSMEAEAAYVRNYINTFVAALDARRIIDYRMAVTNTDWLDPTWGHGQFRGPVPIIESTHVNPVAEFQSAIEDIHMCATQACSNSNGFEMGLNSARQALTDSGAAFLRTNSNLIVIAVSDEQDYSCTVDPGDPTKICSRTSTYPENTVGWNFTPVSEFVTFFQNVKSAGTGGVAYFPIVGRDTADCNTISTSGTRYLGVLDGLGAGAGASGSICQNAMQSSLSAVATAIADNGVCFALSSIPQVSSIEVKVNSVVQSTGYTYESATNSVCFELDHIPANGSGISISYYRL